ncbi:MAG: hypothetical protein AMXMBFR64_34010 [Myxococcales bacterium]
MVTVGRAWALAFALAGQACVSSSGFQAGESDSVEDGAGIDPADTGPGKDVVVSPDAAGDAGATLDGGPLMDVWGKDAGVDSSVADTGQDAGGAPVDGASDGQSTDGGGEDAGSKDIGSTDGAADTGAPDGGADAGSGSAAAVALTPVTVVGESTGGGFVLRARTSAPGVVGESMGGGLRLRARP